MVVDILTLSPGYFASPLQEGLIGRGIRQGAIRVRIFHLRDFTSDRHRTVDDRPYGGGAGMVLKPEPIARALKFLGQALPGPPHVVLLTPRGRPLDQMRVRELSARPRLTLICGRYEGVDERIGAAYCHDQLSIGDYVLSGGEPAALVVLDAVVRLLPQVLGSPESQVEESYEDGLLEYPHYTRPRVFEGQGVPEVLLSGDHERVRRWRRRQALARTWEIRPGLIREESLAPDDLKIIREIQKCGLSDPHRGV
ncbi:MAG: tRNA (guanosine(37)-N1)-methyltransferase TrmD [Desulfobacterota bacterium]|jgi:tRNA (guanine37-N1)-methyltransferase|nr:tRNA (guanosine(37)-N1)-methyltransferase TrmD [Thermodesulfobacteriota bacterium]